MVGLRALRTRLSRNHKIRRAQSLVEFTIMLPILLIMLSGVIEAGIALNVYLDLIDTAREVSRHVADFNPFIGDSVDRNEAFYNEAISLANAQLQQAGQIQLDPATDNLVVSVFRIDGATVDPAERYPASYNEGGCTKGGEIGWTAYCNIRKSKIGTTSCGAAPSCILMSSLLGDLVDIPPDTGVVAVEIYYDYDMTLKLPWITAFIEPPITLHAYSFMPNSAAEPD